MSRARFASRESLAMFGVSVGEVGVGGSVVEVDWREGRERLQIEDKGAGGGLMIGLAEWEDMNCAISASSVGSSVFL